MVPPASPPAAPGGQVISIFRRDLQQEATSHVGIIVFVASWAMLFVALFMSYFVLRIRSSPWPPGGAAQLPVGLPLLATAVLGLSSAILQQGLSCVRKGQPDRYLWRLVLTLLLGSGFLLLQGAVWMSLWQQGLRLTSGAYGGLFYLLTCFHALHVLVGLGFLAWLLPGAVRAAELVSLLGRLGAVTIYWHFVGVVWAVMFVIVYLV